MGKRFWSLSLSLALVAGVFAALPATAADGSDAKFYLRSTGCTAADVNSDYLSIADADEEIECFYTGSGIRNEIGNETGTLGANGSNAVADRATATRYWDTTDGGPLSLDASRPVTGQIYTSGAQCAVGGVPCSPAGAGAGEVILDIALVGISGGTEIELGTQTESFTTNPGAPHLTELSIQPNASFTGTVFETIELRTWLHGASAGHGVVKTNGDSSSFISVPTAASGTTLKPVPPAKPTPPGKNDPPGKGKKKGCGKGSGQQKGACPGKKPKPPGGCPAYVPGEQGAEAATTVVTDAATAEKPVEVTITAPPGVPEVALGHVFQNMQVDSAATEAGLYVRYEFPIYEDHDIYLNYASGSEAAHAGGFNPAPAPVVFDGTGSGGHSEQGAEVLDGIRTSDCGGYTLDMAAFASEGGEMTLKLWLGESQNDPAAPGMLNQQSAADMFFGMMQLRNPLAPAVARSAAARKKKPRAKACAPLAPGEMGAEQPTAVVTAAHTAEAPLVHTISLDPAADEGLLGDTPTATVNVQVDSASATAGLYVTWEFQSHRDYDLWAYFPDGGEAASSHGFQPLIDTKGAPAPADQSNTASNHGGESTADSENLVGIITSDCGGYTVQFSNYFGEGGDFDVKLWLGKGVTAPGVPAA